MYINSRALYRGLNTLYVYYWYTSYLVTKIAATLCWWNYVVCSSTTAGGAAAAAANDSERQTKCCTDDWLPPRNVAIFFSFEPVDRVAPSFPVARSFCCCCYLNGYWKSIHRVNDQYTPVLSTTTQKDSSDINSKKIAYRHNRLKLYYHFPVGTRSERKHSRMIPTTP